MSQSEPIDYVVVGVGHPAAEYQATPYNAGYTFADYLANCIAMQSVLLQTGSLGNKDGEVSIPPEFKRPVTHVTDSPADINIAEFALTEADVHQGPKSILKPGADTIVKKSFRMLIMKPLYDPVDCGQAVIKVLKAYGITDYSKRVIVAYGDCAVVSGSLGLQHGSDLKGTEKIRAIASITSVLGTNEYVRLRLGVGQPPAGQSEESFMIQQFQPGNEMNLFGYCLDLAGQAIQHYAAHGDVKLTKKKHASSKKLPSELRALPGLVFPVEVHELNAAPADKAKEEKAKAKPKK